MINTAMVGQIQDLESPTHSYFHYDFSLLPRYLESLRSTLRIAVIYGGDSNKEGSVIHKTHNPRSWKSYEIVARDIQQTLLEIGFQHVFLMPDDMNLAQHLKEQKIHLAWLNTGGVQGYNPLCHTPATLEMLGIPYIGHNPLNVSILDNKPTFKRELQASGIKSAPFLTWHPSRGVLNPHKDTRFVEVFGDYQGPFVVKPASGRASLHVHVVDSVEELPWVATKVFHLTHNTVLIETYLPGREFCVAVCGPVTCSKGKFAKNASPFAFSTLERVLDEDERIFTSMDRRAITSDRTRLIGEEESELKQSLVDLAQRLYLEFSLRSLIRVDIRADANGVLHVLEANPKPDLKKPTDTVTSLVSMGLQEYGMSYNDLILQLVADRLDYLFTYSAGTIRPIVDLLT
ncbi:MAG TPA: D-alanyl-alanine synthetase [Allocoleopsis sp.]